MTERITRRSLIGTAAASTAALAFGGAFGAPARTALAAGGTPVAAGLQLPFGHGVASGDPLADRVILWTRLTTTGTPRVSWRVASDPQMAAVVASGAVTTSARRDWTVKVDVTGLSPATTYYFDFEAGGVHSIVGRTRTAPAAQGVEDVRIAVVACSSFWSGHFNAYGRIADLNDLDLVVHCGDHIYDFVDEDEWARAKDGVFDEADMDFRPWTSLEEVRRRYALHYSDPDSVRMRQQHPTSIIWDNHDLIDEDGVPVSWSQQAFYEWTPTRPPLADSSGRFGPAAEGQVDPADHRLIFRSLPFGPLADLFFLDTRFIGRERGGDIATRRLLGDAQRQWLKASMKASTDAGTAWRVVVNQVLMGQLKLTNLPYEGELPYPTQVRDGVVFNDVQWDGYPAEREELFGFWRDNGIVDNVVVTGDMHGTFAYDLVEDPSLAAYDPLNGRGSVGVEFAPSSVTRGGADETIMGESYRAEFGHPPFADRANYDTPERRASGVAGSRAIEAGLSAANPNLRYIEWVEHGFGLVHITEAETILEGWWQPILERSDANRLGVQLRVLRGTNHVERVLAAAATRGSRPSAPAPAAAEPGTPATPTPGAGPDAPPSGELPATGGAPGGPALAAGALAAAAALAARQAARRDREEAR